MSLQTSAIAHDGGPLSSREPRSLSLHLVIGIVVSAVCLWIAFRNVRLSSLLTSLRSANYWWLLAYPVLCTALNLVRAEIWRRLLDNRTGRSEAFWAYSVGFLVNNVLPFRMGEAARVVALAARRRLPVVEVAAAAALERMLDLLAIFTIGLTILPYLMRSAEIARGALWSALTTMVVVAAVGVLIVARRQIGRFVERAALAFFPRHAGIVVIRWRELSDGLAVIANPRTAIAVGIGAATVWLLTIVMQWTVLRAFQPAAGWVDAAVMVGVVSIAGAIPAAPGAIGAYQWVGQQALAVPFPALYTPTTALAAAVVSHAASYVFSTLLGALGLWCLGIPFAKLRFAARRRPDRDASVEALGVSTVY